MVADNRSVLKFHGENFTISLCVKVVVVVYLVRVGEMPGDVDGVASLQLRS